MRPSTRLLAALLPALHVGIACGPKVDDSAPLDSDTADTDDSGSGCAGNPRWFCEADWFHAFSVPVEQGLAFEFDEGFFLDRGSVPNFVVLHEGAGYQMLYTRGDQWGTRWLATSTDGLTWEEAKEPLIPTNWFPKECTYFATDSSELYLDDGAYRLLVEGYDPGQDRYSHCSAWSADGETWTPEGEVYEIPPEDEGGASVWTSLRGREDGAWYGWYNGDLLDENTVRVARSTDGALFEPWSEGGVMRSNLVDADLVYLEEGGYRAYVLDGDSMELSTVDGEDETRFGDPIPLAGLNERSCERDRCPMTCYLDPAFLRLPDGSAWLYFGLFERDEACELRRSGISRARAVDAP
jgi:hypothetical protein